MVYDDSVSGLAQLSGASSVDGSRPPERIEVAGVGAAAPAMALSRDRLAFTRVSSDADIYRFEVGRPVQLVVGSTFREMEPRFSPDGRRLAFGSARSGGDTGHLGRRGRRIKPAAAHARAGAGRAPLLVTRRAPDRIRLVSTDDWRIFTSG